MGVRQRAPELKVAGALFVTPRLDCRTTCCVTVEVLSFGPVESVVVVGDIGSVVESRAIRQCGVRMNGHEDVCRPGRKRGDRAGQACLTHPPARRHRSIPPAH